MRRYATTVPYLMALLLGAASADAATVTLAWDPNPESDIAGYKVYYDTDSGPPYTGTQAHEGPSPVDVPLTSLADPTMPQVTLSGLPSCTPFYFAVTAYNTAMAESTYSAEVFATIIAKPVVTATPSAAGLHLTWSGLPSDDSGAIPAYHVNYDVDSGMPYTGTGATEGDSPIVVSAASLPDPNAPSFDLTGLTPGMTYYIMVESACDDGSTWPSTEISAIPDAAGTGGSGGTSTSGPATTGAGAGGSTGVGGGVTSGVGGTGGATSGTGSANGPSGSGGTDASAVATGTGGASSGSGAAASDANASGCSCRVGDRGELPFDVRSVIAIAATAAALGRRRRRLARVDSLPRRARRKCA